MAAKRRASRADGKPIKTVARGKILEVRGKSDGRWQFALRRLMRRATAFGRRIPPRLRTLLGLLLIVGGLLGFLPILGFWMLPLGVLLIILDLRSLRRRRTGRLRPRGVRSKKT
ncbi:MAG: hypothetical protein ACR2QH_04305 [Geminicoccaceae bacterium]